MSELTHKITIQESNLSDAAKKDYDFRLDLFYRFAPIKSDDELIDCSSEELQNILVNYTRHLVKRVNTDDLSALWFCFSCPQYLHPFAISPDIT